MGDLGAWDHVNHEMLIAGIMDKIRAFGPHRRLSRIATDFATIAL